MPAPVVTPVSPVAGATGVSTATPVVVRVTATLPATIDRETLEVAVGSDRALRADHRTGDASILAGSLTVTSATRTFGPDDVGAAVFTTGAPDPRDRGIAFIKSVAGHAVRVTRAALAGTATLTNGSTSITGSGTAWLTDLQPGDRVVANDGDVPYQVLSVTSNTVATLAAPWSGATGPYSLTRTFGNNSFAFDWTVQQFTAGYGGQVAPAGGGANGYDVTVWPARTLTGQAVSTGSGFSGLATAFTSEMHAGTRLFQRGKRPDDPYDTVVSVTSDTAVVTSGYPAGPLGPLYGSRDLPGSSTAETLQTITVIARDSNGLGPSPADYSFSTGVRPRIAADPQVANPFGLAVRVSFSDVMLAGDTATNPAIESIGTYAISVVAGTPAVPHPPAPVITGVTAGPGPNPSYVDLALLVAQTNGAQYRVVVKNGALQADTGNHVGDSPDDRSQFTGYGPADVLTAVKDTQVARPEITGPVVIPYGTDTLAYEIVDLDVDVVAVQLGPSALGVELVPGSFASNRLDPDPARQRTGTVGVRFNGLLQSFRVSIVAIDDVDNVSDESNVIGVTADPLTVPGTSLTIRPHDPVHKATCDRLLGDVPAGTFYLTAGFVVPYGIGPVPFQLNVVELGRPVTIAVTRDGPTVGPESRYQTVIPDHLTETVDLVLGRGRNLIYCTDGLRHDYIVVSSTTYATVLCAVASEIYRYSQVQLDEVRRSVFGRLSTRLADLYVEDADILPFPPVQSQQVASTKMMVRSHVSDSGRERAVRDVGAAVTMQTAVLRAIQNPRTRWQPAVDRLHTQQEAFGGTEHHVWWHADCTTRWSAFTKFVARRPDLVRPMEISEDEVIVKTRAGQYHRHAFNLADLSCSTVDARQTCFDRARVQIVFAGELIVPVCAAVYPFDSCFSARFPLGGRGAFDSDVPWDSDELLDQDPLDPGHDGWVGLCWADRWDSGRQLAAAADGQLTGGNRFAAGYSFGAVDIGRWVDMVDGPRPGRHRIVATVAGEARLDRPFDLLGSGISWRLLEGVRPLDSMGAAPTDPLVRIDHDGIVVAGTLTFDTAGQYGFTAADVGRNLIVMMPGGSVSLYVMDVVNDATVQVGRSNGTTIVPYEWTESATDLSWELWDVVADACVWTGGFSTLVATLASADVEVQAAPDLTVNAILDEAPAQGFMRVVAGASLIDGETFVLNDGVHPATTFEFNSVGGVGGGNVAVPFTALDTGAQVAQAIVAAINGVGAGLAITAYWGTGPLVILANDVNGTAGNQVITETVANTGFVVSGMAGGVNTTRQGSATVLGEATLAVTGGIGVRGAANLQGAASLAVQTAVNHPASATLTGTGSLLARGRLASDPADKNGQANLMGDGFMWTPGSVQYSAGATMNGTGSIKVQHSASTYSISATLTGTGSLLVVGST